MLFISTHFVADIIEHTQIYQLTQQAARRWNLSHILNKETDIAKVCEIWKIQNERYSYKIFSFTCMCFVPNLPFWLDVLGAWTYRTGQNKQIRISTVRKLVMFPNRCFFTIMLSLFSSFYHSFRSFCSHLFNSSSIQKYEVCSTVPYINFHEHECKCM
jgi:hypothetical protein